MAEIIQTSEVPIHWVNKGEFRLDASFYSQKAIAAHLILEKVSKKVKTTKLSNLIDDNDIFMPALKITIPFSDRGKPYLTQSEVGFFLPKARKKVDIERLEDPNKWFVKSGYLLISQSGTIGRVTMATKYLENFIISPNPIRMVVKENLRGYLYAFLSTCICSELIKSTRYGITVKHILPHHLYDIPVPQLPRLEKKINQKILEAHKLREESQEYFLKAKKMLYFELGLHEINKNDVKYFGGEGGRIVKAFEIKRSELVLRLDASYYTPILKLIKKVLNENAKKNKYTVKKLVDKDQDLVEIFHLPTYKRIYVKYREGLPILSGAHLKHMKLWDLKYISPQSFFKRGKSHLEKYRVKEGWILTTERGTTGISCLVTKAWDNWLASHNILRILSKNINPGYLLAYLNTDYAQLQLNSKKLGAVVKVLDPRDMGDLILPIPDKNVQDKIGNLVFKAYDKKDKSNQIEDEAIKFLEKRLKKIAKGKP